MTLADRYNSLSKRTHRRLRLAVAAQDGAAFASEISDALKDAFFLGQEAQKNGQTLVWTEVTK